jgi:GH25 family lysozyme M1 (1,4-beta-N-acetylmuramidase)
MPADPTDPASLLNPDFKVFGADTSLWSLEVDFQKYKAAGASFVIIKALHGTRIDPYFSRNYARARAAGVPVSTYQWLLPATQSPVEEQARSYAELLRDYPHDFRPWLDYEGETRARDLIHAVDLLQQAAGRPIGAYSTFGRFNDAVPALPKSFSSLGLWIARYSTSFPAVPRPFVNWNFWQFTENFPGEAFGFPDDGERQIDMNYFNGSPEVFRAFCDPKAAGTPDELLEQQIEWEVPAPPLASGDRGSRVLKLQDLLVKFSFMTTAQVGSGPGIFGPRTKAAFLKMQSQLGLPASGIFDDAARAGIIKHFYRGEPVAPIDVTPADTEDDQEPVTEDDREPVEERMLFDGNAVYKRYIARLPRGDIQYHVLKADLTNAEIFVTPQPKRLSLVPTFLMKYGMDIAINGDGWTFERRRWGGRLQTTGENASRGRPYGRRNHQSSYYFDRRKNITFKRPPGRDLWNALSFPNILVENGRVSPRIRRADIDPRTALGFTQDGRYAILVAVDGKETYDVRSRMGMNFREVAEILVRHGAWFGSNQDGGGSTTMAIRDEHDGQVSILNEPCGEEPYMCRGKPYRMRPVANHFGIRFLASTPQRD